MGGGLWFVACLRRIADPAKDSSTLSSTPGLRKERKKNCGSTHIPIAARCFLEIATSFVEKVPLLARCHIGSGGWNEKSNKLW